MRVVAALRASGLRNKGTPVAMASTPVRATAPDEKARMKMYTVTPATMPPPVKSS